MEFELEKLLENSSRATKIEKPFFFILKIMKACNQLKQTEIDFQENTNFVSVNQDIKLFCKSNCRW